MKLTDLEPEWVSRIIRHEEVLTTSGKVMRDQEYHGHPATLAEAQGVLFLCPKCFAKNSGSVGTHSVICWFRDRGIPDDAEPSPGRWMPSGTGFHDLTLTPSVDLTERGKAPDEWHGFVTNGEVT